MRYLLAIILLLYLQTACSQPEKEVKDSSLKNTELNDSKGIIFCGIGPEASVDWEEWTAYLNNNLVLDEASLDTIPAGTYKVFIQFVVDIKGRISDVSVLKDPGYGLGKRTMNVISRYKGHWHPVEFNSRATPSYRTQPVTFTVEEDDDECEEQLSGELIL